MTRQQLRAYQQADVDLTMQRRRILYASKCGVGKTLPAVRSVEQAQCFPALVSAPTYLIDQWNDFLLEEGYTPNEIVVAATSATRNGKIVQIGPDEKRALLEHAAHDPRVKWLVVNHEMLRQPPAQREKSVQTIWKETQQEMGWDNIVPSPTRTSRPPNRYRMPHTLRSLIIDESHRLRGSGPSGRGSQQFRGAYQIATRSRIQGQLKTQQEPGLVIEMTATPIYKDVMDLYNQLRLIDPHHFTSRWAFLNAYATYDEDDWGTIVTGATPQAQTLLSRYAIIRDYSDPDVEIDIPPLIPRTLRVTMSTSSQRAYDQIKKKFRSDTADTIYTSSTSQLVALRRITAMDPEKLQALDELLQDCPPAVIFTFYREVATSLAARYNLPLSIGADRRRSAAAVAAAKRGEPIVATIDSLQEGLDLSALRAVIFFEDDYLPGKRTQATMRVQRFRPSGAPDPVLLYWIVARGTIDERVHRVADGRGATADQLMHQEMAA